MGLGPVAAPLGLAPGVAMDEDELGDLASEARRIAPRARRWRGGEGEGEGEG